MKGKQVTIFALGGVALAGLAYVIYTYMTKSSATNAVLAAQKNLATVNQNPSSTDTVKKAAQQALNSAISKAASSVTGGGGKSSGSGSTGGAPPSSGGASTTGQWVNGVRKNADGSTDYDNYDGTFTEIGKNGDMTVYNDNGTQASDQYVSTDNPCTDATAADVSNPNSPNYDVNNKCYLQSLDISAQSGVVCDDTTKQDVSDPNSLTYNTSSPCYVASLDWSVTSNVDTSGSGTDTGSNATTFEASGKKSINSFFKK